MCTEAWLPHLERPQEAHTDLHAPPLSIRHLMHAPLRVNVQHLDQPLLARLINTRHGIDHSAGGEVTLQRGTARQAGIDNT